MNKSQLITHIATATDHHKNTVSEILESLLDVITTLPDGETINLRHFGAFGFSPRASRSVSINYASQAPGEPMQTRELPAHTQLSFKPSKNLRRFK